jgi:hypothetical protein
MSYARKLIEDMPGMELKSVSAVTDEHCGDDMRWHPRPECVDTPGKPLHTMVKGQPVGEDDTFPLLYSSVSTSNEVAG